MPQVDLGVIEQWSPNFMASGTRFIEDSVSTDDGGGRGGGVLVWDDASALCLCTLFLVLLHCDR